MKVWERVCSGLVRYRGWCLAIALPMTVGAWFVAQQLAFNQSIESLFADENPRLQQFQRSKATFGGDEFLIIAYRDADLFADDDQLTDAAIVRLERLRQQLADTPGIDPDSLQTLAMALRSPYGRSRIRELVTGLLLGSDGETTAVVSRLLPLGASDTPRAETFRLVRELARQHDPPAVVVGEPIQVHDMFRYVEDDGRTLGWASAVLLMLVVAILFRSLRWMVLPVVVVQITLLWTKAILVMSGIELSMVSSMLNSLVTIIGIATVMHLTLRYRDQRQQHERVAAVEHTLRELGPPIFWTIVTTIAGFAALLSSRIAPVASFGLMMSLATALVFITVMCVLPGLILLGSATSVPSIAPGETWLTRELQRLARLVEQRPWPAALLMLTISLLCGYGMTDLEVETDFSKNFRAQSPVVQALDFFETHLGGAGNWEVNFSAPAELTDEYLEKVRAFTAELRTLEERTTPNRLTKVVSLTDGLELIPSNLLFTRLSLGTRLNLLNSVQPEFAYGLYNPEQQRMRIMLRALERQPAESKLGLINEVEALARKHFPDAEATGLFVLLAYLIESLLDDQLTSSLIAAAALVILMTLAFRRMAWGLALLIPNLFPIVLVIGAIGWTGMKINIATAMLASVSLGLTIDSSIHYLWGYHRCRRAGLDVSAALCVTHAEVGLALVWANIALVIGFSVLTLSHFIPLVYFGVLVSVAMIGGLVGNLVLLPLLIRLLEREPTVSSESATTT